MFLSPRALSFHTRIPSPIGELIAVGDGEVLGHLLFPNSSQRPLAGSQEDRKSHREVRTQLDAYFAGERKVFHLELAPEGTPFQISIWKQLAKIPFGVTASYGRLAANIGKPKASRAVGLANGKNPIPIILPCHRVIGSTGMLTGFGGGIEIKRRLLALEGLTVENDRVVA